MRIEELKVDNDFKRCMRELSAEEYTGLERSIIKDGVLSPVLTWNGFILDGHNRVNICNAHRITEVPVREMQFDTKDDALVWIIQNQLSRRNISAEERAAYVLMRTDIVEKITAKMRERMSEGGKEQASRLHDDPRVSPYGHTLEKTTVRKELANLAGVSERKIRDMKTILDKGTEEQKERAMRGGKGNETSKIAKEILDDSVPMLMCSRCGKAKPKSEFIKADFGHHICKNCKSIMNKKCRNVQIDDGVKKAAERLKSEEVAEYTEDDVLNEMKWLADGFKQGWDAIISEHEDIMQRMGKTIIEEAFNYVGQIFRKDEHYADFI